jgi:hypothetical protein
MDWAAWWAAHGEAAIALIVGAVIGAFANWISYRKAEKPKRLGWEVMSMNPIIEAGAGDRGRSPSSGGNGGDPKLMICTPPSDPKGATR